MAVMRAPAGLGQPGKSLWRSVAAWLSEHPAGPVVLDPWERVILGECCLIADRIGQIREALDGADLTDPAVVRLLAEERQQRVALSTLLIVRLGFPSGMPQEVGAKKGSSPRSRRAQRAAAARWGTSSDEATG